MNAIKKLWQSMNGLADAAPAPGHGEFLETLLARLPGAVDQVVGADGFQVNNIASP